MVPAREREMCIHVPVLFRSRICATPLGLTATRVLGLFTFTGPELVFILGLSTVIHYDLVAGPHELIMMYKNPVDWS